ncbi:MAG: hypothetical protein FWE41_08785, partial [Coriobacteriia bacterium]|nr:hypothetical protein [Coriobacteriia bacterium]
GWCPRLVQRDGVGVVQRDGVGVPPFAEAKSGTPTPSLCTTPTPSLCTNLGHQPRPPVPIWDTNPVPLFHLK